MKPLWAQINKLNSFAKNFCSTYDESWCFNESFCCRRHKHLPFQCDYNDNEILASYAKGNYDFDNIEQIEEFVVFMGAYEITYVLKILMMLLTNMKILLYLDIALSITMIILTITMCE